MHQAFRSLLLLAALLLPLPAGVAQTAGLALLAQALNAAPPPVTGPRLAAQAGATLYFASTDDVHGTELWRTDGTASGTQLVADIRPGPDSANPSELTIFNGRVYFIANDGTHGSELWSSDGTARGTRLVADINPDKAGAGISSLTVAGSNLFFIANDGVHGSELWVFNGVAASLVKDINAGERSSSLARLTSVHGHLLFAANDGVHGFRVWQSDGGPLNTLMLPLAHPGGESKLAWLRAPGAGSLPAAAPTRRVAFQRAAAAAARWAARDLAPSLGANPLWLTAAGNSLFFTAAAGTRGWSLWDRAGPSRPDLIPLYPASTSLLVSDRNQLHRALAETWPMFPPEGYGAGIARAILFRRICIQTCVRSLVPGALSDNLAGSSIRGRPRVRSWQPPRSALADSQRVRGFCTGEKGPRIWFV